MASMTGSAPRWCTRADGRFASTPISAAVVASSPPAPILTSAHTPAASAPCVRYEDRDRNREAPATLYEGPNLSGRSYPLYDTIRNLDTTGFNGRASSLRVESGYWIFCSDSEFRGECRTFGPGDYASLPGMNNVISS